VAWNCELVIRAFVFLFRLKFILSGHDTPLFTVITRMPIAHLRVA